MSAVGASRVIGLGSVSRLKIKIFQRNQTEETFTRPRTFQVFWRSWVSIHPWCIADWWRITDDMTALW